MTVNNDLKRIFEEDINLITFGKGGTPGLSRARIRPVESEDGLFYQEEKIIDKKAFHANITKNNLLAYFSSLMEIEFKNAVIYTKDSNFYIRRTKKGKLSVMKRSATKADVLKSSHNLKKSYLIPESKPVPFLVELGIMDEHGLVKKKHYSKFRQVNKFLELLDNEYGTFKEKNEINVYDLCCGKGYLTLAIQYYFSVIRKKSVQITGIDLKNDVIIFLNNVVKKLNLENIEFKYGDIRNAEIGEPDIVVALHACDVATDIALAKAVKSGTKMIMSVPCCQHELFSQITNKDLSPILKYGIMKDKFTELTTNALRGLALETVGYNVKMIEFTSLEHTAKNIMIKAVHTGGTNKKTLLEYEEFSGMLNADSSAKLIIEAAKIR